ncbi:hypothetical protein GS480_15725 [Rhodococcus hoagii]|nr:hypothetical protein [Prescottella equi]
MTQTTYVYDDPSADERHHVRVTLDLSSVEVVARLKGIDLDDVIRPAVEALKSEIEKELTAQISANLRDEDQDTSEIGPVSGILELEITSITHDEDDEVFSIHGSYSADGSASVAVVSNNDSGTDWIQADTDGVNGTFEVPFWLEDGPAAEAGDPVLTSGE